MTSKKVSELVGNEILARHLLAESGFELIAQGSIIKKEYIDKLVELGISEVYVEDNNERPTVSEIRIKSKEEVKSILEKHIFKNTADLKEICEVADEIIDNVLEEEEVAEQIATVRNTNIDLYEHSVNVCTLSTVMALKNGYKRETVNEIAKGSLLHDVGLRYITVPYENVDAEEGDTGNSEMYKKHTIYGYDNIADEQWIGSIAKDIVLLHHERLDGSGYPLKYKESLLKEPVQIVSLCDEFDAMTGGLGYSQRKNYVVIEYLRTYAGTKYNTKLVNQLLQIAAMYPSGTKVKLSNGKEAVVVKQNKGYIDRPIVSVEREDKKGNEIIDLTKELTIFVNDVLD